MRIGIDARLVYYTQAGIGQYILRLIEALAKIDREDEFIILQSRKDETIVTSQANFRRRSLWTPSHHRLEQWTLPLEIGMTGLDLLHSPDFIPPFHRNYSSVITIHDLAFLLYPHFVTRESARYYGQIDRAVQSADHIIAVSESTKWDTIHLLGVPEDKITVIYEAANPVFRPIDDQEKLNQIRAKYGIWGDFILFVSTIEPRKNLPNLLRAFQQFLGGYDDGLKLVVVGRHGWLFEEVSAILEELDLEEVIFTGKASAKDLLFLYNAGQGLVYPSLYEGFGLPPLEAMACGTPVVTSNVSSLPEVVGDAALMVDPEDISGLAKAIGRVLTDEALRKDLIERGFKQAKLFSWERTAKETLALYRWLGERG